MSKMCELIAKSSFDFMPMRKMLLLVAAILFFVATSATYAQEFKMRPRLGHFARYDTLEPISKIYELYVSDVIKASDDSLTKLAVHDWRNFRPTPEICLDLLLSFSVQEDTLTKPYDLIAMDACLDWLEDKSEEKDEDLKAMGSSQRNELASFETKEMKSKLSNLFRSTKFRDQTIPASIKEEVYNYLTKLLKINAKNPTNGCHSLWLEAYTDFIENVYLLDCNEEDETKCVHFGDKTLENDSYLNMIVDSTRLAAKSCYEVMHEQIPQFQEEEFQRLLAKPSSLAKRLTKRMDPVTRQSNDLHWPRPMVQILQFASGSKAESPVELGKVVHDLALIQNGDEKLRTRFKSSLSEFAMQTVNAQASPGDGRGGRVQFAKAMTKLCGPYIDPKQFLELSGGLNMDDDETERSPFQFYNIIYSLVRMTNHEQIFELSKTTFEENVLENNWEALYLATFACQIVSTTFGKLNYNNNKGTFTVMLRPNADALLADWPLDVMAEQLPLRYPDKSGKQRPVVGPSEVAPSSQKAAFGGRLKFKFSSSEGGHDQATPLAEDDPPAQSSRREKPKAAAATTSTKLSDKQKAPAVVAVEAEAPPNKTTKRIPKLKFPIGSHKTNKEAATKKSSEFCPPPMTCDWPPNSGKKEGDESGFEPTMSLGAIMTYKDLKGHYPSLDAATHNYYVSRGQLPADLSGTFSTVLEKYGHKKPEEQAAMASRAVQDAPEAARNVWGSKQSGRQQQQQESKETFAPAANKWNKVGNLRF